MWKPAPLQTIPMQPVQFQRDVTGYRGYPSQSFRVEAPVMALNGPRMVASPDALSQTCAVRQAVRPPPAVSFAARPGVQSPMARPPLPKQPPTYLAPTVGLPAAMRAPMAAGAPGAPTRTCPMVASPCGSSRVVLRATSPHRAASPVTTATAASASASAMAALSPVRARVRLPERSPMKARVLEVKEVKKYVPKKVVVKRVTEEVENDTKEVKEDFHVDEAKTEVEETQSYSERDVQVKEPEEEEACNEVCGLSQGSTQASEVVDETRRVRPLPPRPTGAAPEPSAARVQPLLWEMQPDKHPSEAESERVFLSNCLTHLVESLEAYGGLQPVLLCGNSTYKNLEDTLHATMEILRGEISSELCCELRSLGATEVLDVQAGLIEALESCATFSSQNFPRYLMKRDQLSQALSKAKGDSENANNATMQMIRFALEEWAAKEIVQERLRNGGHNLFVQEGWMMSMGNKKVVKLFCRCEGAEGKVSVCWDWDVKLEGK